MQKKLFPVFVYVRMTAEMKRDIDIIAKKKKLGQAEFCRNAITFALNKYLPEYCACGLMYSHTGKHAPKI